MGLGLFFSHLFGDYFLQFPFGNMSTLKRTSSLICAIHVCIYTLCHTILVYKFCEPRFWVAALILIGTLHFLQDRFWIPLWVFEEKLERIKNDPEYKIWYPPLYIALDNGYHLFSNWLIILSFAKHV